jgi:hypothetical protein
MVGTIVVIGRRIYDPQVLFGSLNEGSGNSDHPQLSPEPGGGWWQDESDYIDCLKDGVAYDVAQRIKSLEIRLEQGALIHKETNGNVVAGAIAVGDEGGVEPSIPLNVGYANVLGQIHSHPPRGDPILDALSFGADRYPSPDDWNSLAALAVNVAMAGGTTLQLSMYIVDQSGAVREFRLADRATYDVPAQQLLGQPGYPPPPPLPDPITTPPVC